MRLFFQITYFFSRLKWNSHWIYISKTYEYYDCKQTEFHRTIRVPREISLIHHFSDKLQLPQETKTAENSTYYNRTCLADEIRSRFNEQKLLHKAYQHMQSSTIILYYPLNKSNFDRYLYLSKWLLHNIQSYEQNIQRCWCVTLAKSTKQILVPLSEALLHRSKSARQNICRGCFSFRHRSHVFKNWRWHKRGLDICQTLLEYLNTHKDLSHMISQVSRESLCNATAIHAFSSFLWCFGSFLSSDAAKNVEKVLTKLSFSI